MKLINKINLMLLCVAAISCSNMISDQKGHSPGQVKLTALSTDTDSITMTWTDPSDSSLAYELVTCNNTEMRVEKGACTCTVSGLSSGTDYAVEITSYDKAGRSSDALTFSATTASSGTRTYYLIYTAEDMYNVRNDLTGYYLLMADISLSSYSDWTPIGSSSSNTFSGSFDGNGHVIRGLTINSSSEDNQGLFGVSTGIIKNVGVKDVSVIGNYAVGGLAGWNYTNGKIIKCYVTGSVTGSTYIGGLVGFNVSSGIIINSYSTASVKGVYEAGGLAGGNGDTGSGYMENCYAAGSVVETSNIYPGGLVGHSWGGSYVFCYYDGTTSGYYAGQANGETWTGVGNARTSEQMKLSDTSVTTYDNWDFSTVWGISGTINSGYPYLLENVPE